MNRNNARNTFFRIHKREDSGNIDNRMSVLLLEAAWLRPSSKCAGAVRYGGASKASQPPLTGTLFYSLLVGAFKRCSVPKGTLQYSRHQAFPPADLSWKLRGRFVDDKAALAMLHQPWVIAVRLLAGKPKQFQSAHRHRNIGQARCRQAL